MTLVSGHHSAVRTSEASTSRMGSIVRLSALLRFEVNMATPLEVVGALAGEVNLIDATAKAIHRLIILKSTPIIHATYPTPYRQSIVSHCSQYMSPNSKAAPHHCFVKFGEFFEVSMSL